MLHDLYALRLTRSERKKTGYSSLLLVSRPPNNSSRNGMFRFRGAERKEPAGVGSRGRTSKLTCPRGILLLWHQSSFFTDALTPLSLYFDLEGMRGREGDERRRRRENWCPPRVSTYGQAYLRYSAPLFFFDELCKTSGAVLKSFIAAPGKRMNTFKKLTARPKNLCS